MKTVIIIMCSILLFAGVMKAEGLEINTTASMPIGVYQKTLPNKIHRGDIVAVCLPENIARVGLRQGYLMQGNCASGAIPVLKKIIGLPHDTVIVGRQSIVVNGVDYAAPQSSIDDNGKPVKQFIVDSSYKNTSKYWLWGMNDVVRSWDSRYYGGVKQSAIMSVEKPIIVF